MMLPRLTNRIGLPLAIQMIAILVCALIGAQLVTLALTVILPPSPTARWNIDEVAFALKSAGADKEIADRLERKTMIGPPDVSGQGWLVSESSREALAGRLGRESKDVVLAFYTQLPVGGVAVPSSSRSPLALRDNPAAPFALSTMLVGKADAQSIPGGPPPGGMPGPSGMPGGHFPGGQMPGGHPGGQMPGGRPGGQMPGSRMPGGHIPGGRPGGHTPGGSGTEAGNPGNGPGNGGTGSGTGNGSTGGGASAPGSGQQGNGQPGIGGGQEGFRPGGNGGFNGGGFNGGDFGRPGGLIPALPAMNDLPHVTLPQPAPAPIPSAAPSPEVTRAPAQAVATATPEPIELPAPHTVVSVVPPPVPTAQPLPAVPGTPQPIPFRRATSNIFALTSPPFIEGDFVAALRQPDGQWIAVAPRAEPFPNAWQKRVMLWFALSLAIISPFAWLFARRIVLPLRDFARAAEQLGRDPSATILPLRGPAEIGRAANAFNQMRNRLRAFVDDRTAMVGAISHDLRTPLTRLRFRIEDVPDEQREGLLKEVTEMEAMISQVIGFIRDASTPGPRERTDFAELIASSVADARLVGGDVTIERNIHIPVDVDPMGIRRLLDNLLENAVKYGERARVRVSLNEGEAVAEIVDTGPGIPEEEYDRAFEPFYRTDSARKSGQKGSGLGLAVCRSIARAHGGDVSFTQERDGFTVRLAVPAAFDQSLKAVA
ncbi:signal transduction histidine kinase [Novosphingobium sp. PhB165]|uniref:ATP-binding protein n=1 Tax=Novosphingobium sp. PhB165 TaxID=2485105 RepID=UPI001052B27D|nr:ATP-binding protein [Novosphingobium sp. PhB165]TCM17821.1 signal transduction histidine kinase [Novosphingobium sp. PhB165]